MNGKIVTEIDPATFSGNTAIKSVVFDGQFENFSPKMLAGCTSLEAITLTSAFNYPLYYLFGESYTDVPSSLKFIRYAEGSTYISETMWNTRPAIQELTLILAVDNIHAEKGAYWKRIIVPDGVTKIEDWAFYDCKSLLSVVFSDSVKTIGQRVFHGCTSLSTVVLPKSLMSIGNSSFKDCRNLSEVYYSGDIAEWCGISFESNDANPLIFARHFYIGEKEVTELEIPDRITLIGDYAFYGYSGLKRVTMKNGVANIGNYAFAYCSNLTNVSLADSVISLGDGVFYRCTSLTSLDVPDGLMHIGDHTFDDCPDNLLDFYGGIGYLGNWAIRAASTSLVRLTIQEGTVRIARSAFSGCSSLTSVSLPESLKYIEKDAFSGCSDLTGVYYSGDIAGWCGITFESYNSNPLVFAHHLYINNEEATELEIPYGVSIVGTNTFAGCSALTSVIIPDTVTSIESGAFSGCSGLTSITIPDSVMSIGNYVFSGCSGLTNITIPGGVTSIESSAFYGCSGLTSVVIPDSVTSVGDQAFYNCSMLPNITIPDSVVSIGDSAFFNCSKLTRITISSGVISIGSWAFYNCKGLKIINYQDSKAQWDTIRKGADWNSGTGNYAIICTDGTIDK